MDTCKNNSREFNERIMDRMCWRLFISLLKWVKGTNDMCLHWLGSQLEHPNIHYSLFQVK